MDSGVKHGICSKCGLPTVVTLPTELRGRTAKAGADLGGESRRREARVHMNVVPRITMNTNVLFMY